MYRYQKHAELAKVLGHTSPPLSPYSPSCSPSILMFLPPPSLTLPPGSLINQWLPGQAFFLLLLHIGLAHRWEVVGIDLVSLRIKSPFVNVSQHPVTSPCNTHTHTCILYNMYIVVSIPLPYSGISLKTLKQLISAFNGK